MSTGVLLKSSGPQSLSLSAESLGRSWVLGPQMPTIKDHKGSVKGSLEGPGGVQGGGCRI